MGDERKIIKKILEFVVLCRTHSMLQHYRIAVGSPFTMAICLHLTTVKRKLLSYKFSGLFFSYFFNRITTTQYKSLNRIITIMYTAQQGSYCCCFKVSLSI